MVTGVMYTLVCTYASCFAVPLLSGLLTPGEVSGVLSAGTFSSRTVKI